MVRGIEREIISPTCFNEQLAAIAEILGGEIATPRGDQNTRHQIDGRLKGGAVTVVLHRICKIRGLKVTGMVEVHWFDKEGKKNLQTPLWPEITIINEPSNQGRFKSVTFKGLKEDVAISQEEGISVRKLQPDEVQRKQEKMSKMLKGES